MPSELRRLCCIERPEMLDVLAPEVRLPFNSTSCGATPAPSLEGRP